MRTMMRCLNRRVIITLIAALSFATIGTSLFSQEAKTIGMDAFMKKAEEARVGIPYERDDVWTPLFEDAMQDTDRARQDEKISNLLTFHEAWVYAYNHAVDLVKGLQYLSARERILLLYEPGVPDTPNDVSCLAACPGPEKDALIKYMLEMAMRPANVALHDPRERFVDDEMEFLFEYYRCTKDQRYLEGLLNILRVWQSDDRVSHLTVIGIVRLLTEMPSMKVQRAWVVCELMQVGEACSSLKLKSEIEHAVKQLNEINRK